MIGFHSLTFQPYGRQAGRWYLHRQGLEEAFGKKNPRAQAKAILLPALVRLEDRQGIVPYFLGFFFAHDQRPIFDLFTYYPEPGNWQYEPSLLAYRFDRNILSQHPGTYSCPDILIVLATEIEHRRKSRSKEHYLTEAPRYPFTFLTHSF